ncbi:MAG: LbtU family siderophore porin [Thermodesulfobacteriota bacterium]|nr:LbtU family siderophore porin [Thermodesulfobacteriota bacterium]
MKKYLLILMLVFGLAFPGVSSVYAGDIEALNKRIEALEAKAEKRGGLGDLSENITFSGAIELDYSYTNPRDTTDVNSDSTSDLDIGTAQLGVEVNFHECVTGNLVLKGENLDNDDRVFWDEAIITIQKEGFPLYFVGGHRGQPFGVFENHLISDPITQDCYEVVKSGATLGLTYDPFGLDVSATVYKGEILMDHLAEFTGYLDRDPTSVTRTVRATYEPTDDVDSFIGNITISPIEGLTLGVYYDSEPGDDKRNETAGGMFHYEFWKLTLDAEYIGATQRETEVTTNKEYKESAWFAAVACQVTDPLEIALRYEAFDDDISGEQDGNPENRHSIGANYTLFEKDNFVTTVMVEYRETHTEKVVGSTIDDTVDEFFAKLAIEF